MRYSLVLYERIVMKNRSTIIKSIVTMIPIALYGIPYLIMVMILAPFMTIQHVITIIMFFVSINIMIGWILLGIGKTIARFGDMPREERLTEGTMIIALGFVIANVWVCPSAFFVLGNSLANPVPYLIGIGITSIGISVSMILNHHYMKVFIVKPTQVTIDKLNAIEDD